MVPRYRELRSTNVWIRPSIRSRADRSKASISSKRADGADVEPGLAVRRRPRPGPARAPMSRVDLGVRAVLGDVVVEQRPTGGERRDAEVGVVRGAVGEDDGRLVVGVEQVADVGGQRRIEVGAPERAMARRGP